jgi:hypothetical protein
VTLSTLARNRLDLLVAAGELLVSHGVPVLPIKAGGKAPIPHPATGSWWTIDDPDNVRPVFQQVVDAHGDANLAALCGRGKQSPLVVVDIDGTSGLERARLLGCTSSADCWVARTGGGGWHLFYYGEDGLELHRQVKPQGVALDLLVDGYALIEPSITKGSYRWQPGHSPVDIPLADLAPPPADLVGWWLRVQDAPASPSQGAGTSGRAWGLLREPIPEGQRHDSLVRVAGWLRLYHPKPVGLALLEAVNDARCVPPLPVGDIERIVQNVWRYPQPGVNGHPKALVNPWRGAR